SAITPPSAPTGSSSRKRPPMTDPFCYVLASSKIEARDLFRRWVFSDTGGRSVMERWDLCFKGQPDAEALLKEHHRFEGSRSHELWRIDIEPQIIPTDVPRETSAPDEYDTYLV